MNYIYFDIYHTLSALHFLLNFFVSNKTHISSNANCLFGAYCVVLYKISLGYIKDFQVYDPHRVGRITVQLQGRINDCKALTHRQDIKARDIEQYKIRTLPTRQVCLITLVICPFCCERACPGIICVFNFAHRVLQFLSNVSHPHNHCLLSLHAVGLCCDYNSRWSFRS